MHFIVKCLFLRQFRKLASRNRKCIESVPSFAKRKLGNNLRDCRVVENGRPPFFTEETRPGGLAAAAGGAGKGDNTFSYSSWNAVATKKRTRVEGAGEVCVCDVIALPVATIDEAAAAARRP